MQVGHCRTTRGGRGFATDDSSRGRTPVRSGVHIEPSFYENCAAISGAAALTLVGFAAPAALADTAAADGCVLECSATFDTAGVHVFTVPVGALELSASLAGSAGGLASNSLDPGAIGGGGGAATIALGDSHSTEQFTFGLGAQGSGSYLRGPDGALIAIAGGGGGGGYAGYLHYPDQVLAALPGGNGGSPVNEGVNDGQEGTVFHGTSLQGRGGTTNGGAGGWASGAGSSTTLIDPASVILAPGGSGAAQTFTSVNAVAGAGGSGHTGGGGGGINGSVPNGDVRVGVVGAGGGGSGFLADGYAAAALAPNAGNGYVTFSWSYAPVIGSSVAHTERDAAIPVTITGLPVLQDFDVVFDGVTVLSGTSDVTGAFAGPFVIDSDQAEGDFALELWVGGVAVASSTGITVTVPGDPDDTVVDEDTEDAEEVEEKSPAEALAKTGSGNLVAPMLIGIALMAVGVASLTMSSRRRSS